MSEKSFESDIPSDEITPEWLYLSRRKFFKLAATMGVAAALAACAPAPVPQTGGTAPSGSTIGPKPTATQALPDVLTPYDTITHYNNYYEFSEDKAAVAALIGDFKTSPWSVKVYGMVSKSQTYTVEDLIKLYPPQKHVYRHRCVEGWSIVVPWNGFPLAALLKDVAPTAAAKYVRFETALIPNEMPGVSDPSFPWPYNEGLRLDEAMNELALLATGLYDKPMPPQDGAPIRLVLPWKYGFKSIKSIVKIELVDTQPATLWSTTVPEEYGFYANVNPNVPHPRWSQATERRIGEIGRRPTLMFNGYSDQVANLYNGMDLRKYY